MRQLVELCNYYVQLQHYRRLPLRLAGFDAMSLLAWSGVKLLYHHKITIESPVLSNQRMSTKQLAVLLTLLS